jgi:hypothetical protein
MAYDKNQTEPSLPISGDNKRESSNLLPNFYRTGSNKKFLQATVDQLTQPGTVRKINGFVGRKNSKASTAKDIFIGAADKQRQDYQLEPAVVVKDPLNNITYFKDYIDYINQLSVFDGITANHNRINQEEFYSWNPHIDWDKFVNFQQYYWLPFGPDVINVSGQQQEIISTYTVKLVDEVDNVAYLFTPNGLTRNPTFTLYRGQTYNFEVTAVNHPFFIKTIRSQGVLDQYNKGITNNGVEEGVLTFEVPLDAPNVLFYVSGNEIDTGGVIQILDIEENTFINLTDEIIGKKNYSIPNNTETPLALSNGMKLNFIGKVIPEEYAQGYWYVEGVGTAIKLISEQDLEVRSTYIRDSQVLFDDTPFDQLPFSEVGFNPAFKDYITINRSSPDNNPWSRYNRWFHQDVVIASAAANNKQPELDQNRRATRPIIEFNPGIKLFNFGTAAKKYVDVIDNFTTDVFSTIEGSAGYNIDGIDLANGMRVLFNADTDSRVKNRVYKVNFINVSPPSRQIEFDADRDISLDLSTITFPTEHGLTTGNRVYYLRNNNVPVPGLTNRAVYYVKVITPFSIELYSDKNLNILRTIFGLSFGTHKLEVFSGLRRQIHLTDETDSDPIFEETVSIKFGTNDTLPFDLKGNQGLNYWFNGETWKLSQTKIGINQAPLFDLFDEVGTSFTDLVKYEGSNFLGNKIFSYCPCEGRVDPELGFAISYRNINNIGDIVFDFNLLNEQFAYKQQTNVLYKNTNVGFLKIITDINNFVFENGWKTSIINSTQPIVRVYNGSEINNNFPVDVFDNLNNLDDLSIKVYVNAKRVPKSSIEIVNSNFYKIVKLNKPIENADVVTLKCFSKQQKNANGYYEFPINLQNNPLNEDISSFTLGQVIDHVDSIVDYLPTFVGSYPGTNNLRDLGNVSAYGTRFVQHSAPINLSLYHVTSKDANIISTLDKSKEDYGKFKRSFILAATESSFDGSVKDHVDFLLQKINKNKPKNSSYYLSDMFAYQAANKLEYTVLDSRIKKYPLTEKFSLTNLSNKAVSIYLNDNYLVHGLDYVFGDNEFFEILKELNEEDQIVAYEFTSTDGCFCPPTPTKLGIYPKFEPAKFLDDTYKDRIFTFDVNVTSRIEFFIDQLDSIIQDSDIKVFVDDIEQELDVDYVILKTVRSTYVRFKTALSADKIVTVKIPVAVVRGHDGSLTVAFSDYRDDLILELEKRIFNNIKIDYNTEIFDLLDYIPGHSRTTAYSKKEFDAILSRAFYKWLQLVNEDFTKSIGFDVKDSFTYNYVGKYSPDERDIPAFWRGIYTWYFDTDRPHSHPWEILGFSIKPSWWETVYGPAPYTSNNLVLWNDIKTGTIREPNKIVIRNPKVARSILEYGLPVDEQGQLLSPALSTLIEGSLLDTSRDEFVFGDFGVVENAWRKSSYYPFALLRTLILMSPSTVIAKTIDRSRIVKNLSNQLVYKDTNLRIKLADIVLPSVAFVSTDRVYTSGLVNYIVDFLTTENTKKLNQYANDLKNLTNNISSRLGAFTSKAKYRILLDSKSPNSSGGVFVPEENYRIELNTSSPIKKVSYSGVIITKRDNGFEVKGYDYNNQYFVTYPFRLTDKTLNVGGISEIFATWAPGQYYVAGKIIKVGERYFRVNVSHTAGDSFDTTLYTVLAELPIVGGRSAVLRKSWDFSVPTVVAYNTIFPSIQDTVDFLQGYGIYLESQGFVFDEFNTTLASIANWETSIKEFLFWTTQNWTPGAVISLSPAANKLVYRSNISVVENISDTFYDYSIFKVDGKKLETEFLSIFRSENEFSVSPINTSAGVYSATLYLIQKEHILLLDDKTLFNDVIYDKAAGYRQERLKVLGYVTSNWTGGFETPGFIYDQRDVTLWESWTDYNLGDIIKHKESYYSAKKFIPGEFEFNPEAWYLLSEEPKSRLLPNWDYKIEQFTDFYDLDTDNFDVEQQRIAQHLIGYQKRQYLENIINNDVSQYKFYQGMIAEKGTQNVLNKLFDVLSDNNAESLTFDEEWAVRVGEYGAIDSFNEVEFIINENEVKINPQPIELVDEIDPTLIDFVYRQRPSDVYIKPDNYSNSLLPELYKPKFLRSMGYVRKQDVLTTVDTLDDLLMLESLKYTEGDYIHATFESKGWNIYRITKADFKIINVDNESSTTILTCNKLVTISAGTIITMIGVADTAKFYKILTVVNEKITLDAKLTSEELNLSNIVFYLRTAKLESINNLNDFLEYDIKNGELVWVDDDGKGISSAFKNSAVFKRTQVVNVNPRQNAQFGIAISAVETGNVIAVSSDTEITIFDKGSSNLPWNSSNRFYRDVFTPKFRSFGSVISLSKDGEWFVISAPNNAADTVDDAGVITSYIENEGYFNLYKRNAVGRYFFVKEFKSPTPTLNEKFGSKFVISKVADGHVMLVQSGVNKLRIYKHVTGDLNSDWTLIKTIDGSQPNIALDFSLTADGTLVVGDSGQNQLSGKVSVFKYNTTDFTFEYDLVNVQEAEIFKISKLNGVVTVVTTKEHNFVSGYRVTILSTDDSNFNVSDREITVTGPNTFTYILSTFESKKIREIENLSAVIGDRKSITKISKQAGVVTVTTENNHNLTSINLIDIEIDADSTFDVESAAISIVNNNNFTYQITDQSIKSYVKSLSIKINGVSTPTSIISKQLSPGQSVNYFVSVTTILPHGLVNSSSGTIVVDADTTFNSLVNDFITVTNENTFSYTPATVIPVAASIEDLDTNAVSIVSKRTELLSKISKQNGIVTVTTVNTHNFSPTNSALVNLTADSTFDISNRAITIVNPNTFRYQVTDYASTTFISAAAETKVQVINNSGSTPVVENFNITEVTKQGSVVTVITDTPHNLSSNVIRTITLNEDDSFNSTNVEITVVGPTIFTYVLGGFISAELIGPANTSITIDDRDFERFGYAVSLSSDGNYLAASAAKADVDGKIDSGTVSLYKKENGRFEIYQVINSRRSDPLEMFGSDVEFMNNSQTLIVYSKFSDRDALTSFDNQTTVFDNTSTSFKDIVKDAGRIDVYDRLDSKFIYSESLFHTSFPSDSYGNQIAVGSNVILVGAVGKSDQGFDKTGTVYSYIKPVNQLGWMQIYKQEPNVDTSKIKKVFLYNRVTNQLITYLDVVDVNQGKIAGVADQEIKFKTYYDPAIYSSFIAANLLEATKTYEIKFLGTTNWNTVAGTVGIVYQVGDIITAVAAGSGSGTASINGTNVDEGLAWTTQQVGMLWWDLTKAKFVENNIGDVVYKAANWNRLHDTASIDVYEWVESKLPPAEWSRLADTEEGLASNISGTPRYGNGVFSVRNTFDKITQTSKVFYYFWVKNKTTVPFVEGRSLSAADVANLIADPVGYGYPCLAVNSANAFSLINVKRYLEDENVVLNIQYWLTDSPTNYHSEWKLISLNETTSIPTYIEQKWFHSLVGKDNQDRVVPDFNLPVKNRYGVEFKPRQSMFVNRLEALKQFVEGANFALKDILVADTFDLTKLNFFEETPSTITGQWDLTIDIEKELRFVSTVAFNAPRFNLVINNGKITNVEIINGGQGYGRLNPVNKIEIPTTRWYGPDLEIIGQGKKAKIKTIINFDGTIVDIEILDQGYGYTADTNVAIRPLAVLVLSDSESLNTWSIYHWIEKTATWTKVRTQAYDVRKYWKYIDWYKLGFDQFTKIDYVLDNTYQLITQDLPINSIIKITNVGSGGWSLFRKFNNIKTIDYTENFEIVGRQNGSIELLSSLYKPSQSYDAVLLDTALYDSYAVQELRLILDTLKNNILVDTYKVAYLKLFFSSVRYVMHEQLLVDWVFKSSFVKAMHRVGELKQKINFNSDNLEFFEEYINEVKPYATKIREYISEYSTIDPTKTAVMDFDLLPVIDDNYKVSPLNVSINNNVIISPQFELAQQPWANWADNLGFEITAIEIINQGSDYVASPTVEIIGNQLAGGKPAQAKAFISNGKVNRIKLISPGSKWISAPTVIIKGGKGIGTVEARAVAILGNSVVRSSLLKIKFDRISKTYQITSLNVSETFETTAPKAQFVLKWSPNTEYNKYFVTVNGVEFLKNEYSVQTASTVIDGTTFYSGLLTFNTQVPANSTVVINYNKNFNHLSAADRINFYYDPQTGQLGKDLGLLMTGVDYGGVSITGTGFEVNYGWDTLPWFVDAWDSMDPEFDDYIVSVSNETDRQFKLPYVPSINEPITIYISKFDNNPISATYKKYLPATRIDDENYLTINQTNPFALMTSFMGDGETDIVTLPNSVILNVVTITENDIIQTYGDRIIFRKITSDGSINNPEDDYDTKLTGGDLAYRSATGFAPDDIILDGDGLVTANTSHAPEEVVPGQIMDTLAIKVYSRPSSGAPNILFKSYLGNGVITNFEIGQYFSNNNSVIVKVDDTIATINYDYTIDYKNNSIVFSNPPLINSKVNLISISFNSANLLDLDYFVSDGVTTEFITKAPWLPNINVTVLVNGDIPEYEIFSTDSTYTDLENQTWRSRVGIKFAVAPEMGDIVNFIIDTTDVNQTASVIKTQSFISTEGQSVYQLTNQIGVNEPFEANVLVKLDNRFLSPASYEYFKLTNNQLKFDLKDSKYQYSVPSTEDITVYVNNSKLRLGIDYSVLFEMSTPLYGIDRSTFVLSGGEGYSVNNVLSAVGGTLFQGVSKIRVSAVSEAGQILSYEIIDLGKYLTAPTGTILLTGGTGTGAAFNSGFTVVQDLAATSVILQPRVYVEGAPLIIGVTTYAEYKIDNNQITFSNIAGNSIVDITSFFNHNILAIERTVDRFNQTVELAPESPEYYQYSGKLGGIYQINKPVVSGDFVWVIKNGELLINNQDYYLETDFQTLRITGTLSNDDEIQIIAFTNTVVSDNFGYMQFKDAMNRVHYKRLNANKATALSIELKQFDKEIVVVDASVLDNPNPEANIPGIIEINGERIEYFIKQGNRLSQLRRATLGTGSPLIHQMGSLVQGFGASETIPYKDQHVVDKFTADGVSNTIVLPYAFDNQIFKFANQSASDLIEVFVQGYRLKKADYKLYSNTDFPYSPAGDVTLPPEFAITQTENGETILELATIPPMGAKIAVIKRQGQYWTDAGKRLANSKNSIASFITAANTVWPEA